ncbi:MAG TPA: ATP-binding protein [Thermoanaerobaculia bacterium]|jgi:PAS domain S-box-containing protein
MPETLSTDRSLAWEAVTAAAARRMVAIAVAIGLVTVLGTGAVIYLGYTANLRTLERRLADESRHLAQTIVGHVRRNVADDLATPESRTAAYRELERFWREVEEPPEGAQLLVVDSSGRIAFHTGEPALAGQAVHGLTLDGGGQGGPRTMAELLERRTGWSGRAGPLLGEEQLLGGVRLEPLDVLVAVHLPVRVANRRMREAAMPWGLYVAGTTGVLVPLSLLLLYRGYRVAQRTAFAAAAWLRQSEARYRHLYHNTPIMMHSIDAEGRLMQVNDHWLRTLGYERGEVIGRHVTELLTDESRRFALEVGLPGFFAAGHCRDLPYQVLTRDGRRIDVLLSATAERDAEGRVARSLASLIDVTELRRAEAEREEVIRQLERKNAELERFTYTVSHDLKSPLVTIKGFLGYVNRDLAAGQLERVGADLERVAEATDRMRALLDDLLEISRVGRMGHPPEDVELAALVDEALAQVAGALSGRGVEVAVAPGLPRVHGDRVRLVQVLQNLIENAAKFMGDQPAPRIEVGGRRQGAEVLCFVADNGVGIDAGHRELIFDLFHKLRKDDEGTGIGLALVRRIVEVHGGRAWVESAGPGRGSTFYFTLPDAAGPDDKEDQTHDATQAA